MTITLKGHELNSVHDMKKLSIVIAQVHLEELQKDTEKKRAIQITTSSALIIAKKISTQTPDIENLPLLDSAILKSEDTIFPLIKDSNVTNISGMIVLNDVKIVPFANPENVIEYESYAVFSDHIMGFSLTD
ncbi:hypothetical protein AUC31_11740 [Planococcus rifietoensis]|uniref:Uncharacterized protein n=1 Tax=Planococcus rifietoensis TaxID=200991 RepID=A0A0U2Z9D8_9BACL|nr:hypothetical protein [Planococcus rifietoensis]ALS75820.1 hypothetical protein AUC31_11740 [Planococcus rifietoensis]